MPYQILLSIRFQFTHPGRGATPTIRMIVLRDLSFNSRTPGGVRHYNIDDFNGDSMFQFTHPGRGATEFEPIPECAVSVSFHAPREGCDWCWIFFRLLWSRFNSRTPGGVRLANVPLMLKLSSFNSRTPGGVRLPRVNTGVYTTEVSIHAPREGCDLIKCSQYGTPWFQFTHPGRGATTS